MRRKVASYRGRSSCHPKPPPFTSALRMTSIEADRGIGALAAYALAGSEENARGHLVVTAPTGGSAGVLPSLVYGLGEGGRKLSQDQIRQGMLAAAAIGYLCKHNATLVRGRGWMSGGDRRSVGDGRRIDRRSI